MLVVVVVVMVRERRPLCDQPPQSKKHTRDTAQIEIDRVTQI
jgi:hypothetical protein